MMKTALSFDDVLLVPKFSKIKSRAECDTSVDLNGLRLKTPIISSNMDSVTEANMSNAMHDNGAIGCLHRFCTIDQNVEMFLKAPNSIVSVGITENEKERVLALKSVGATQFVIDVAHGASSATADMYSWMRKTLGDDAWICVGNFATYDSYLGFSSCLERETKRPNALKLGVGGGSVCTTRIVTGCGLPTLQSLLSFRYCNIPLIADGGVKNSGDLAKCLASGASAVMIGNLISGTEETPGDLYWSNGEKLQEIAMQWHIDGLKQKKYKKYRGSASRESYLIQNKESAHRTPEGESILVPYKGPVKPIIQQLRAGLMSAMSYVGASNIKEFKLNAELVQITNAGLVESKPHGVK